MKVIMTGGGTGGHIYPAIAIADKIKQEDPTGQILFVGTERGKESELVPQCGYPIEYIKVRGLDRKNWIKNIKVMIDYGAAMKAAGRIIDRFKPDCVIGTGGYVSAPLLRAAAKRGIKTYVQEQNAIPGLTNKLLEREVEKVFLGFQEASTGFNHPEKHVFTGNPVRRTFYTNTQLQCRQLLQMNPKDFVILAFGGSQGAGRINKAMIHVVEQYNGVKGVTVVFVPGKYYYLPVITEIAEKGIILEDNIKILEYIHDMDHFLPAADLVICRSGALTVSEISVCGKASILIPSPIVTGDHQLFNANVLGNRDGAIVIEEKNLTDQGLFQQIEFLKKNPEHVSEMGKNSKNAGPQDATEIIWETIKE